MHEEFIYELIGAYVDGEVTAEEHRHAETLLVTHDDLRLYRDELLCMRESLHQLPRHGLSAAFAQGVLQEIEHRAESPNTRWSSGGSSQPEKSRVSPSGPTIAPQRHSAPHGRQRPTPWQARSQWQAWKAPLFVVSSMAVLLLVALSLGLLELFLVGENSQPQKGEIAEVDRGEPIQIDRDRETQGAAPVDSSIAARTGSRGESTHDHGIAESSDVVAELPRETGDVASVETASRENGELPEPLRVDADPSATARTETRRAIGSTPVPKSDSPRLDFAVAGLEAIKPMYVVDVVLSARGIEEQFFAQLLERAEVPWMDHILVDAAMEQSLLATRYFGKIPASRLPLETTPGNNAPGENFLQLVFVVARGTQIVDITEQLEIAQGTGEVVAFRHDLVMGGNVSEIAGMLSRSLGAGENSPTEPVRAQPLSFDANVQQRLLASLPSVPNDVSPPPTLAESQTNQPEVSPPRAPPAAQAARPNPSADPFRVMENQKFLALFFLRSEQVVREEASR